MNRILATGLFAVILSGLGCAQSDSAETVISADPLTAAVDESAPVRNGEGSAVDARSAEFNKLVYEVRLRLPRGSSQWVDRLSPPQTANQLKIVYIPEPSCPRSPGLNFYVHSNGNWYNTSLVSGVDHVPVSAYDGVRFDFVQPLLRDVTCTFRVYAPGTTPPPPPPPSGGVLAGAFDYQGGFVQNLDLPVASTTRIRKFRLQVPSFCAVEVLAAGTVTENIYDPASPIVTETNAYDVAGDSARVSAIRVSLNGNAPCDIPVFIYPAE